MRGRYRGGSLQWRQAQLQLRQPPLLLLGQLEPPVALPHDPGAQSDGFLVSAGPRNTVVIHPDDAPELWTHPGSEHFGCCGFHGENGMNRLCPCGNAVGTVISECYTAYELHLDPSRVRSIPDRGLKLS